MTTGFKGKDLLLKSGDGATPEVFTTIAGLQETGFTFNAQAVDVTNKDSSYFRTLLDTAGVKSLQISAAGVFADDAAYEVMRANAHDQTLDNYRIELPNLDIIQGLFKVTNITRTGAHDGAEQYSLSLESHNQFTYHQVVNPDDIASLAVWLDATDSSTLTIATGVSSWADKSGMGNNATQGTGANQPTVNSTGINGLPALVFDTTDLLSIADAASLNYTQFEAFVVCQRTTDAGAAQVILQKYGTGTREFQATVSSTDVFSVAASTDGSATSTVVNTSTTATTGTPFITNFGYNGTNLFMGANNATPTTGALASIFNSTAAMQIGFATGAAFQGRIAHVMFFTASLTAAQRTGIYNYLANKHRFALI